MIPEGFPILLTLMWAIPILGMVLLMLIPNRNELMIKWVAVLITAIPLILAIVIFLNFARSSQGYQYAGRVPWINAFNIHYAMGIDGISVWMVLLTALLGFIGAIASWGVSRDWAVGKSVKIYYVLYLLLEAGLIGFFCALDFIVFFVFWELTLLPMYFLIGVWGTEPRKEGKIVRGGPYAAIKFFLYTLFGSVLMLLAILAVYFNSNPHSFDITTVRMMGTGPLAVLVWFGFFIGFAIKVPIFPFHTWLPDAHVEAPTPISVILAGVLLKMGGYGIIRVNLPILPEATKYLGTFLAILGVINIIYGALCAMAQTDLKRLVAYSSIGHMGFVLLGIASFSDAGINGAIFQMLSHGLLSGMLFLIVGVIYDRVHHRFIVYPKDKELMREWHLDPSLAGKPAFGGLGLKVPVYTGIVSLAFFGSLGLPGLSGFIGEALSLLGAFGTYKVLAIISVLGIVIGAAYFLWTIQRMFLGKLNPRYDRDAGGEEYDEDYDSHLTEINGRELATLIPLGVLVIVLGVYPAMALNMIKESVLPILILFG
jgi:NADH-quinone oxidoreductase subunit M